MSVSAHDVAVELRRRLPGVGTKKLHKLLYYAQGHHLATMGTPLFTETISAWDTGPVVGQLWYREKHGEDPPPASPLDQSQLNTVGYVVSRYGALSGLDLEHLTHSEDPWRIADHERRPGETVRIDISTMAAYFGLHASSAEDEDEVQLDSRAVTRWLSGADERRNQPVTPDDPAALRRRLRPDG